MATKKKIILTARKQTFYIFVYIRSLANLLSKKSVLYHNQHFTTNKLNMN